jgi:O-antigen ligase
LIFLSNDMQAIKTNWAKLPETISLSLLAAMWLLPFLYHSNKLPIVSYHSEWLAVLLGLLAVLAGLPVLFRGNLHLPRIALLPLALAAFLTLQPLLLPEVVESSAQLGMAYLLWAALLMTLAYNLLRTVDLKTIIQPLAVALLLGAVFVSVVEFWLRFFVGAVDKWGGLGQAAAYTDYLSLGLASALYCWARPPKAGRWVSIVLAVCTALIIAGLSLSTSSAIWIYLLALMVLAGIGQAPDKKRLVVGLAGVVALFVALQLICEMGGFPAKLHVQTAGERFFQEVHGAPVRWHLWQAAWQLFLQSPWLGQGFGQFDWGYFTLGHALPELPDRIDNAHNLILQLLAELGLLPVVMVLAGLGAWLAGFLKAKLSLEGWWLLALLAILGLHSLVEYPLWYSYFLGIAAVLLGLGEQKSYELQVNRAAKWGMGLAIPLLILLCVNHFNSYRRMEKLMEPLEYGGWIPSMPIFLEGMKSVGEHTPELTPYVAVVLTSIDKSKEGNIDTMLILGDTAMHFMPTSELVYRQALLLALAGKRDESTALMRQSLNAYPLGAAGFVKDLLASSPEVQQKAAFLVEMVKVEPQGH